MSLIFLRAGMTSEELGMTSKTPSPIDFSSKNQQVFCPMSFVNPSFPAYLSLPREAAINSRFILAMFVMEISFGHSTSQAPVLEHIPKPSASI